MVKNHNIDDGDKDDYDWYIVIILTFFFHFIYLYTTIWCLLNVLLGTDPSFKYTHSFACPIGR